MAFSKLSLDFPRFFNVLTSNLDPSVRSVFRDLVRGLEKLNIEVIRTVNDNADCSTITDSTVNDTPIWTAPTLLNSWVNYGSGNAAAGYTKVGNRVEVKGLVRSGTVTANIFTLPTGYRPAEPLRFATISNNALGRINILTDGSVDSSSINDNTWLSLDGIAFYV